MNRLLQILSLVLLIGLGAYYGPSLFERYEYQVKTGASPQALRNPYLAAQYYLSRLGLEVEVESGVPKFEAIPPQAGVFMAEVDNILVTDSTVDAALAWVEQGGHLVGGVGIKPQGRASLIRTLGIDVELFSDWNYDEDESDTDLAEQLREINRQIEQQEQDVQEATDQPVADPANEDDQYEYFLMPLEDSEHDIQVAVVDTVTLDHQSWFDETWTEGYVPSGWVEDQYGVRFLQFEIGEGSITLASGPDYWNNEQIGLADHAYLLSYFLPSGQPVYFYTDFVADSLSSLVQRIMPELAIGLGLLLFFWLWYRMVRIQPIKLVPDTMAARFEEHLTASVRFLENQQCYATLLMPLHQDIENKMRQYVFNFSTLSPEQQVEEIYLRTQISKEFIKHFVQAMSKDINAEEYEIVRAAGRAIRERL